MLIILDICDREQDGLEAAQVGSLQGPDKFLGELSGGDCYPAVDLLVAIAIDSPARPTCSDPAILVCLSIEIAIDITIDLDTVLVVAPEIDLLVLVRIDKTPQQLPVCFSQEPAHVHPRGFRRKDALFHFLCRGLIIINRLLYRLDLQRIDQ